MTADRTRRTGDSGVDAKCGACGMMPAMSRVHASWMWWWPLPWGRLPSTRARITGS